MLDSISRNIYSSKIFIFLLIHILYINRKAQTLKYIFSVCYVTYSLVCFPDAKLFKTVSEI